MVTGFNVYYGAHSRGYTNFMILGNTTSISISNLVPGAIYYFAATCVNAVGLESDFSDEASYFVPPSSNQAPTLDPIGNVGFNQDSGLQVVQLTGISSGLTNVVPINITAVSTDTNLLTATVVSYTSPNTTAGLTLVPGTNLFGTTTVTVTVDNGQPTNNTVSQSFIVTMYQTNDNWTMWWQHSDGSLATWQMQGTNYQSSGRLAMAPVGTSWRIVGVGDFEGNGNKDLLWQHTAGWVALWSMQGTTRTASMLLSPVPAGTGWKIVSIGDFDGNRTPDILWQSTSGWVSVWLMDHTNVISKYRLNSTPVSPSWQIVATGHFGGTTNTDILWQNSSNGTLALWNMNGTNFTRTALLGLPRADSTWRVVGALDIVGNGQVDLIWQNQSGPTAYWLLNGTNLISSARFSHVNTDPSWRVAGSK
jgi:hypothetical protein